jgi:murein L,D-transpeptidase YafK
LKRWTGLQILAVRNSSDISVEDHSPSLWRGIAIALLGAVLLAGCQESSIPKQLKPVPSGLTEKMRQMNMSETGPVFIRIFKESSELEVWKQQRDKKYALLKTYNICRWSGVLGPKVAEGDRQAPEGFYTVTPGQMNPKSSYYLAFNIGYPNAFDRSHGRTGSHLMVHGACSSAGCYSMTDEDAGELFALARDSFRGGQRAFQIQAFPFRMTPANMAKHRDSQHFAFWKMLKTGYDTFEITKVPPKVDVCGKQYVFNADAGGRSFSAAAACPAYQVPEDLKIALEAKEAVDEAKLTEAVVQLKEQAAKAAEEKRVAEENRVAAEAEAARKQAAKEARVAKISKKLGVFGRLLGGDKDESDADIATSSVPPAAKEPDAPLTAFAPADAPVPPPKPKASGTPAPAAIAPAPVTPPQVNPPIAETETKKTITPEMTPENPPVGSFVKKEFLWPGEGG